MPSPNPESDRDELGAPVMTKSTLQVLIDARALIEKPENWWDGRGGELAGGKLCLQLAIAKAGDDDVAVWGPPNDAVAALVCQDGFSCCALFDFNDSHPHPEVIALLDRAIEAERAKVQA